MLHVDWKRLTDDLGPEKVVMLHNPLLKLKAFVVIDNTARGPAIGGLRMSPGVGVNEVRRLARAMTLKSAAAGLPHGGAKAGLVGDPTMNPVDKERLVRTFARAMSDLKDYVPGPDMGTDEACMAYIHDEIERAVGLPEAIGGIALDKIGTTAYGLAACAEVAQRYAGIDLAGSRVVIQGFGSVGLHSARLLAERGATIVAVADSRGGVANPKGLDVDKLIQHKRAGQTVHSFGGGKPLTNAQLVGVDCDIWIPAAQPDVIDEANVGQLRAKLVLCGANIPITSVAEIALHDRGVLVVPDFIANAGGVICAAVEYRGGTEADAFATIKDKISHNTEEVLRQAAETKTRPRTVALELARARVREAMSYRRHGLRPSKQGAEWLDM